MLEGLRQERHQWRERLAALERLRGAMRPAPEAAPDGAALRAASREVLRLRQVLSEQPEAPRRARRGAAGAGAAAAAGRLGGRARGAAGGAAQTTGGGPGGALISWKRCGKASTSKLLQERAQRQQEVSKWRRRMALLRLGALDSLEGA